MGGDIAAWCVTRGITVSLQDRDARYVEPALARARELFKKRMRAPGEAEAAEQRLLVDVEAAHVAAADLVIEAIFEDADAKKALYAQLEPKLKPGALLATNTSSLRLEDLSTELAAPEQLVGLHFFNPVAKLPLVEVIRSPQTSDDAFNRALAFATQIGKLPLPCRSAPGFVVNRLLAPYMLEAMLAHEEGLSLETIDRAAEEFGMPVGPVELADRVGLDVASHVAEILGAAFERPVPPGLAAKLAAGELGAKTGQGFYRYVDDKAQKSDQVSPAPIDLTDRLILPMLNEAVACLADGVVEDPDLLDAGVIFGTGFAPFTGGPIHYARQRGIQTIVARLEELASTYGERFQPHESWAQVVENS
jgi:3-hydroxyacyl-CoA dehydrogenase/enoyl-CoA hydratase/3-hydroxybutyryl-CoA epimerase